MCLFNRLVMFIFVSIDSVVPAGMVTVEQDESAAAFRKAGASSDPLAVSVHASASAVRPPATMRLEADAPRRLATSRPSLMKRIVKTLKS